MGYGARFDGDAGTFAGLFITHNSRLRGFTAAIHAVIISRPRRSFRRAALHAPAGLASICSSAGALHYSLAVPYGRPA